MMKKYIFAATSMGCLLISQPVLAEDATGTLNVSLDVQSGCEINVGGTGTSTGGTPSATLTFPTVTVFGSDAAAGQSPATVQAATGTSAGGANAVTINCSSNYDDAGLQFAIGSGGQATGGQRYMVNGSATVAYNLAADPDYTTDPWDIDDPHSIALTDGQAVIPIYATAVDVAANATADGTYSDSVTMTLTY